MKNAIENAVAILATNVTSEFAEKAKPMLEELTATWSVIDGHSQTEEHFHFDALVYYKGQICPIKTTALGCCLNPVKKLSDTELFLSTMSVGPMLTRRQMQNDELAYGALLLARK